MIHPSDTLATPEEVLAALSGSSSPLPRTPGLPDGWDAMSWTEQDRLARNRRERDRDRLAVAPSRVRAEIESRSRYTIEAAQPFLAATVLDEHEARLATDADYARQVDIELAQDAEAARLAEIERRLAGYKRHGIPSRQAQLLAAGKLDDRKPLTAARAFVADPDAWSLVLVGDKGLGKTVAAAFVSASVNISARPNAWVSALELAKLSPYGDGAERMAQLVSAPVLVIDDVGVSFQDGKGFSQSVFDMLIGARYDAVARTVITSNLKPADFAQRVGERVYDRLQEGGHWSMCKGESLRVPRAPRAHLAPLKKGADARAPSARSGSTGVTGEPAPAPREFDPAGGLSPGSRSARS